MIHGRERDAVRRQAERLARLPELARAPRELLFSRRRFKQCGAAYRPTHDPARSNAEGTA